MLDKPYIKFAISLSLDLTNNGLWSNSRYFDKIIINTWKNFKKYSRILE
jgi:hypothetical protein